MASKRYWLNSILLTLVGPVVVLLVLGTLLGEGIRGEAVGVATSTFVVIAYYAVAGRVLVERVFGRSFYQLLGILIVLRVVANVLHFFYIFGPLAGIDSSGLLPQADFSGDLGVIHNASTNFADIAQDRGYSFAIFGDYYRGFNNPGVPIVFGSLFGVFGASGLVAIPWLALYSGFSGLLAGVIGLQIGLSARLARLTAVLVVLMPGFFISPPLYRDTLLMFLLVLSAYTALQFVHGDGRVVVLVALALESIALGSLRQAYAVVPAAFTFLSVGLSPKGLSRKASVSVVGFGLATLAASAVVARPLVVQVFSLVGRMTGRIGDSFSSSLSDFAILAPFKALGPVAFYPAAAVYSVLAPMPWWQPAAPALLSYQVFAYGQTFFTLSFLVAVVLGFRRNWLDVNARIILAFAGTIWLMALLGSLNLTSGYVHVAAPFVVLGSIRVLVSNLRFCTSVAAAVVLAAHLALFAM